MYLRASLVRFYGFSNADFESMSFGMFLGYIEQINELRRIESGRKLSNEEAVERTMKATMKAMKKRKRNE